MSFLKSRNLQGTAARPHPLAMSKDATPRRPTFILEWREFRGMSQEELGHRIGMTGGNVSQLERGLINYKQDTLEAAADALDCTVVDLLTRKPEESESMFELWRQANDTDRRTFQAIAKEILRAPKG